MLRIGSKGRLILRLAGSSMNLSILSIYPYEIISLANAILANDNISDLSHQYKWIILSLTDKIDIIKNTYFN